MCVCVCVCVCVFRQHFLIKSYLIKYYNVCLHVLLFNPLQITVKLFWYPTGII